MGYPMNYGRVVNRNQLNGDYDPAAGSKPLHYDPRPITRGDLRRMEQDQRDEAHLAAYAKRAGITPAQVKQVLDDFLADLDVLWASPIEPLPTDIKHEFSNG